MGNHKGLHEGHDHASTSLVTELMYHVPYAIFSVSIGLIVLSFLSFYGCVSDPRLSAKSFHALFHSFHFLHLIFATTGSLVTFSRFSKNVLKGLLVSVTSALFFCSLSDIIFPYLAGRLFGVAMHFHICLVSEIHNIVPFLIVGVLNGLIMSRHEAVRKQTYSVASHFGHILSSSLASLFYLVGEGFVQWHAHMGLIFLLLILAVVVPCTFADVIVPVFFAQTGKKDEKHQARQH